MTTLFACDPAEDSAKLNLLRGLEIAQTALKSNETFLSELAFRKRDAIGTLLWRFATHLRTTLGQSLYLGRGGRDMDDVIVPRLYVFDDYHAILREMWARHVDGPEKDECKEVVERLFQIVEFVRFHSVSIPFSEPESSAFSEDCEAFLSALGVQERWQELFRDLGSWEFGSVADRLLSMLAGGHTLRTLLSEEAVLRMGDPNSAEGMYWALREAYYAVPRYVMRNLPELRPGWNKVSVMKDRSCRVEHLVFNLTEEDDLERGGAGGEFKMPNLPTPFSSKRLQAECEEEEKEAECWYHVCRVPNLFLLLVNGIDTQDFLQADCSSDFSSNGAFYVNSSAAHSLACCVKRAEAEHVDDFAIIRFKVVKSNWASLPGRVFASPFDEELIKLVKNCRKNDRTHADNEFLRPYGELRWIRGPVVLNSAQVSRGHESVFGCDEQVALLHEAGDVLLYEAIEACAIIDSGLMERLVEDLKRCGDGRCQEDFEEWRRRKNDLKAAGTSLQSAEELTS